MVGCVGLFTGTEHAHCTNKLCRRFPTYTTNLRPVLVLNGHMQFSVRAGSGYLSHIRRDGGLLLAHENVVAPVLPIQLYNFIFYFFSFQFSFCFVSIIK